MPELFRTTRRVEFAETDAAGIAHFSAFFLYMEQAEHALLRHVGLSVFMEDELGAISWPRAAARCDYEGAVRFEEVMSLAATISRLGTKSVSYEFAFTVGDRDIARGSLTAVCCRVDPGQPLRAIPIPEPIAAALRPYVQQ